MENIPYELIARYFAGECNDDEVRQIQEWSRQNPELMNEASMIWEQVPAGEFTPDTEQALLKVNSRLDAKKVPAGRRMLIWASSAAAVVLILIMVGIFKNEPSGDIHPIELLTLQTNDEKSIEYALPDGSKVWLNRSSTLLYPEEFDSDTREVQLEGEAFFDITPDTGRPFLIRANGTLTHVVGTSFSVKAVKDAPEVIVTVSTGIVNFSAKGKDEKIELKQGEQGVCHLEELKLEKNDNPDPNMLAWKTGQLVFKQTPLSEVARLVGDVYDVHVSVEESINAMQLNGTFDRLSLDEVLQIIEMTLQIQVKRENGNISLTR